jgi:hypothetical protein
MSEHVVLRGEKPPSGVDPKNWFEVNYSSSWLPQYTQFIADAQVFVGNDAPKGLFIRQISVEAVTQARLKPVRAAVNVWRQQEANCHVHDHNYTREQPPGFGKIVLTVEFEGSYLGRVTWEKEFNHNQAGPVTDSSNQDLRSAAESYTRPFRLSQANNGPASFDAPATSFVIDYIAHTITMEAGSPKPVTTLHLKDFSGKPFLVPLEPSALIGKDANGRDQYVYSRSISAFGAGGFAQAGASTDIVLTLEPSKKGTFHDAAIFGRTP